MYLKYLCIVNSVHTYISLFCVGTKYVHVSMYVCVFCVNQSDHHYIVFLL